MRRLSPPLPASPGALRLAALAIAGLFGGCAGARPPEPTAASAEVPAVRAESPARAVTLNPEELTWDEAAGTVSFTEDSAVQKAEYTRYVLDLASLEAALGGRPTAPVTVNIAVSREEEERETPDDPMLPAPEGGFRITTVYGRVVAP